MPVTQPSLPKNGLLTPEEPVLILVKHHPFQLARSIGGGS